jgi:hypothetical protein
MTNNDNHSRARRRALTLAIMATIAALTTGCGGSSTSTSTTNAGGSRQSQALAFAQCMRSHGVADFPDPNADGRFPNSAPSTQSDPNFGTASSACKHLIPRGGSNGSSSKETGLLHIAQCMRSHGVPNYPDPNPGVDQGTALNQAGVNTNSPQFQSAARTCDQLYPPPSASAGNGGGS